MNEPDMNEIREAMEYVANCTDMDDAKLLEIGNKVIGWAMNIVTPEDMNDPIMGPIFQILKPMLDHHLEELHSILIEKETEANE